MAAAHTFSTAYIRSDPTPLTRTSTTSYEGTNIVINISSSGNDVSTGRGILIGMLSAFGSAAFVAFIFIVVYFFKYTSRGRIILDRVGRPGQYDDEQAFAREEAEALESMDEMQRLEYLRAKGGCMSCGILMELTQGSMYRWLICDADNSFRTGESTGDHAHGYLAFAILGYTGKGRLGLGV